MYVIWNTTEGAYVADMRKSRTGSSFTRALQGAKTYPTREHAQGDCCGNEYPRALAEVMR